MRLVILETPYAGDIERNVAYARLCLRDCLARGESPIASHLLFTQPGVLDDANPDERALGIAAGHAWYRVASLCAAYVDFGMSEGMQRGLAVARAKRVRIETRRLWPCEMDAVSGEHEEAATKTGVVS